MAFTLGMDEDSYILTADILGWVNILCTLVIWYSPNLGVWVNFLQYSSGIGVSDEPVGFFLGYEIGLLLGNMIDSETCPPVGFHLIVDTPNGLNLRYPNLVGSLLRSTLAVPPSVSCSKFPPPPSEMCPTSPSQSTIAVTLSVVWPTITWRHGRIWHCFEAKGDKK